MKKILLPLLLVVLGAVTAVVAVSGGSKLLDNHTEASNGCARAGHAYQVTIVNAVVTPASISGHRCDMLTITNRDAVTREIGFGQHDHHVAYDGISEKILRQDENLTISLVTTGEYHYHDHFHDEVAGSFSVTD